MFRSAQARTAALLALAVAATTPVASRADFIYSDFSSTAGLQINGNAAQVGNVLRVTPAAGGQSGSAFTTTTIPLGVGASFSTYFQFRIGQSGGSSDGDGLGADGIVFAIQTVSSTVGAPGGGIGYAGISPSVGIEFDTWFNPEFGDTDGNHVGLDVNGSLNSNPRTAEPTRFNNGQVWNAWIDYNGTTNQLEVRWSLSTTRPVAAQLSGTPNIAAILGTTNAYVGFTSGTGSAWGNHDILQWEFRSRFDPIGAVPEPATALLLGVGVGLCGAVLRRGRPADAAK